MKLYQLPRNTRIQVKFPGCHKLSECTFHHIDGMYSYCTVDDDPTLPEGENVFHLSAWTEMIKDSDIDGDFWCISDQPSQESKEEQ